MKDKIQYCASLNRLIEEWHQYNKTVLKKDCNNCNFKELCETMNELKGEIDYLCKANGKLLKDKDNLLTAHKKLEQELAELKQKAIVPKFVVGQEIWDKWLIAWKIKRVETHQFDNGNGNTTTIEIYRLGHDGNDDYSCCILPVDNDIFFATREEAEQKFAEIRGKL